MPYDDYIDQRILTPLGMINSTSREPLPSNLAAQVSNGYMFLGGAFVAQDFERLHNIGPAGSMSASAVAMSKFLLAHLQTGSLLTNFATGKLAHWAEVADGLFRDVNEDTFITFKNFRDGHATRLVGPFPVVSFERVRGTRGLPITSCWWRWAPY